jgi:hypothetical protein
MFFLISDSFNICIWFWIILFNKQFLTWDDNVMEFWHFKQIISIVKFQIKPTHSWTYLWAFLDYLDMAQIFKSWAVLLKI